MVTDLLVDEKKASLFRKYFIEVAIVALVLCVMSLFKLYLDQEKFIRENLLQMNVEMRTILQGNTEVMQEIKKALE